MKINQHYNNYKFFLVNFKLIQKKAQKFKKKKKEILNLSIDSYDLNLIYHVF